jgi:hypothetical protein
VVPKLKPRTVEEALPSFVVAPLSMAAVADMDEAADVVRVGTEIGSVVSNV